MVATTPSPRPSGRPRSLPRPASFVPTAPVVPGPELLTRLSPRERRVCALMARGFTLKDVALILCRSLHTVCNHAGRIRTKLGIHRQTVLALWAVRAGLLDGVTFAPETPRVEAKGVRGMEMARWG